MAAPKNRRSIEVNRCRRRNPQKLIKVKNHIDVCPECGHLKQKHILCGYCYEKVRKETAEIRRQMGKQEGGPLQGSYHGDRGAVLGGDTLRAGFRARGSLSESGSGRPGLPRTDTSHVSRG
uniref:Large ribosomal subunit protein bL32m n=1 Tax=Gekko japonicus TaxID=146911 RepID=Q5EHU9_GEKJA|nr:GekBS202P [Gekko japonicus]